MIVFVNCDIMCSADVDSTGNHCNGDTVSECLHWQRIRTYPTGHQTKTTETRTNTESTLTTELDSDETERLITRRDKRKVSTTEQVRREGRELRLGEHAVGVHLHETGELLGGETTVEIDDGTDSDELDRRTLLESIRRK